jgi:amino acid adenylation domain-containing protein
MGIQTLAGMAGQALFEALFVFENYPTGSGSRAFGLLALNNVEINDGTHYPVALAAVPGKEILLRLSYDKTILDDEGAIHLLDGLRELICVAPLSALTPIGSIPLYNKIIRSKLIAASQGLTETSYNDKQSLIDLFEKRVTEYSDTDAIVFSKNQNECISMTYAELNKQANKLARTLIGKGIGPEQIVAILLERSPALIVAILAVLKTGAAYMPLDPDYPGPRLRFMIKDSKAKLVISTDTLIKQLTGYELNDNFETHAIQSTELPTTILVDELFIQSIARNDHSNIKMFEYIKTPSPENIAYVIYTSGSTGTPKGVSVTRASQSTIIREHVNKLDIKPKDRYLQMAAPGFDVASAEIGMTLIAGATLVITTENETRLGQGLVDTCNARRVTHFMAVPNVLETIPESFKFDTLKTIVVGGDQSTIKLIKRFSSNHIVINAYGPTETTVAATMSDPLFKTSKDTLINRIIPIGKPLANVQAYLLDAWLEPVP